MFLRSHVGLGNEEMGTYMSLRGLAYTTGTAFSRAMQSRTGPQAFTSAANALVCAYLLLKARTSGMRGVYGWLLCYCLAPMYIRSSGVQAMFYERGLKLGLERGESPTPGRGKHAWRRDSHCIPGSSRKGSDHST